MLQVTDGVRMARKTWGSNVYVLTVGSLVVVDGGFPMDARRLSRRIREIAPGGPDLFVATHYHLDHTGAISRLAGELGGGVAAHTIDAEVMEGNQPYETYRIDWLRTIYYKSLSPLFRYRYVDVDLRLEEGDMIDALGGLEVVHVPGHTAGSIALYQKNRGILFSGDTLRNENGLLEGPPPQFSTDLEAAYRSIEEKILPLDFDILLPGHGEPLLRGAREAVERMITGRKPARVGPCSGPAFRRKEAG